MPRKPETPLPGADALRQMAEQDGSGLFAPQQPDPACAGLFLNRELAGVQPPRDAGGGGHTPAAV